MNSHTPSDTTFPQVTGLGIHRFGPMSLICHQFLVMPRCVLARVMVDMLAPVGVFQFGDAGPVAGRQWFRYLCYTSAVLDRRC